MALSILGIGYALPDTVITNDFISELDQGLSPESIYSLTGIKGRRTTLPLAYLRETQNRDPWQAPKAALEGPTDLSYRAAIMALERAGISAQQIGLVVGDTATPYQTTPGESQRLACRLGLKIPAYDVISSGMAMVHQLNVLSAWREERMPEYVLCVSSNVPTQNINYSLKGEAGAPKLYFGDAAAAWVVSMQHAGKLRLVDSFFGGEPDGGEQPYSLEIYGVLRLSAAQISSKLGSKISEMFRLVLRRNNLDNNLDKVRVRVIGSQLSPVVLAKAWQENGIPVENQWCYAAELGDSLGAGAGVVLGGRWDALSGGEKIAVCLAGPGLSFGYALLESD